MTENIKRATIEYSDMIGEVFNLYRVFYNQESNVEIAQKYIKQRLENNESIIFFQEEGGTCAGFTQFYPTFDSVNVLSLIHI